MTVAPRRGRPLRVAMVIPYDLEYQPFTIRSIMFGRVLAARGHRVVVHHRPLPIARRGNIVHQAPLGDFAVEAFRPADPRSWRILSRSIALADVVHLQKADPACTAAALGLARLHCKPVHHDWDDDDLAFCVETVTDAVAVRPMHLAERGRRIALGAAGVVLFGGLEWAMPGLVATQGAASMALRRRSARRGLAPDNLYPARVGVDAELFRPERRDEGLRRALGLSGPTVLYSGHFDVQGDLEFLVAALRELVARKPTARCLIVGGGSGRSRLAAMLDRAGLQGTVVMSNGFVPYAAMPRYTASCDIAAIPLRDTPRNRSKSSLTLLEAMACGLPTVTHDVGDAGWMLGDGGLLAPVGDPAAFGAILATLVGDAPQRFALGQRARARALARFSWEHSVDHLEAAYQRALARRGSTRVYGG